MWIFKIAAGLILRDGGAGALGSAYSGHGEGRDNVSKEAVKDVGPLPEGYYTIGPPYTDPHKGPLVMRLTPDPGNKMNGRGSFLIHGDNAAGDASLGCIVASRPMRQAIASSGDTRLRVEA